MKSLYKILFISICIVSLTVTSCRDYDELNTNPTKSSTVDPNSQLTYVQLMTWGDWVPNYTYYAYCSSFVQQLQGEWNTTNYGGQYRRSNEILGHVWNSFYGKALKNIEDMLFNTKDKPLQQNVRAVGRIFRVYYFMILTDLYGDIPYFNAGKGYLEGTVSPTYDKQEDIYKDLLKELKEVELSLNSAGGGGTITGDVVNKGDISKWKRFANALRLRAAMRLVNAAPEQAKQEVNDILSSTSGLLTSNESTYVPYLDINDWSSAELRRNALSQSFRSRDTYPGQFICSVFWKYLKENNDPRLLRIGRAYEDTPAAANNPFARIDLTDEILQTQGIEKFQPVDPGYSWAERWPSGYFSVLTNKRQDKACRPQLNNAFLRGDAPGMLMSYAEVQLLLSEAKVRWPDISANYTAAEYYSSGVTAAMNLLTLYKVNAISSIEINTYLDAHPFPQNTESALKAINEQLWVLHFNNPAEAYSNWRRTRYPQLMPSNTYGKITIESQIIPTRLNYPLSEATYNKKAFADAIAAMGGSDNWNARVWWDKK